VANFGLVVTLSRGGGSLDKQKVCIGLSLKEKIDFYLGGEDPPPPPGSFRGGYIKFIFTGGDGNYKKLEVGFGYLVEHNWVTRGRGVFPTLG